MPSGPPSTAQLTGPLLLGHFFNWGLFGALSVQAYIYYIAFPHDKLLPKCIVSFVYIFEVLQTVLATRDGFRDFGTGWGSPTQLEAVGWLWFSVPVMGAIISCSAQVFFAWRIWVLSLRKPLIPIVVLILSAVQCTAGVWSGIYAHFVNDFEFVQQHTSTTTIVWLGGTALCDVIIAACMLYYLTVSRTGFRSTTLLLDRLIRVTVETGLICATFAILDLSLFLAFKDNNYHLAPSIALSKLYSNSLLVVLNARVRIVGGRSKDLSVVDDSTLSGMVYSDTVAMSLDSQKSAGHKPVRRGITVAVSRQTVGDDDIHIPMTSSSSSKFSSSKFEEASSTIEAHAQKSSLSIDRSISN